MVQIADEIEEEQTKAQDSRTNSHGFMISSYVVVGRSIYVVLNVANLLPYQFFNTSNLLSVNGLTQVCEKLHQLNKTTLLIRI